MSCYLLFEDGTGVLKLEDGTGNLSFEVCDEGYTVLQGPPLHDYYLERQNEKYRQAKRDVARRQEAIIQAKLDTQEMTLRKRDLEKDHTSQSARQLRAIEAEIEASNNEILQLVALLHAAEAILKQRAHNLAIVLLMDADPFFNIGGLVH